MRKYLTVTVSAVLLLAALAVAPAAATTPSDVVFTVPTAFGTDGLFTADGPAVYEGVICETGIAVDRAARAAGFQSQSGVNFQFLKEFVCDDGSGSFFVKLQVRLDRRGDNFQWTILDGTGDYTDLHGSGSGFGLYECGEECVIDIYEGKVHID